MSLRGDAEIDSLLSLMGGGDESTEHILSNGDSGQCDEGSEKRKSKKSKKRRRDVGEISLEATYVKSRLDQDCFAWPQSKSGQRLLTLGTGLAHDCKGYVESYSSEETHRHYGSAPCSQCNESSSTHELCVSFDAQQYKDMEHTPYMSLISIIVAARNARCVLGEYYIASASKKNVSLLPPTNSVHSTSSVISRRLDFFSGRVLIELRKLETKHRMFNIPTKDHLMYLKKKTQPMINAITSYKKALNNSCSDIEVTDQRLKAMACCDMVYYRCYYTSITFCNSRSGADKNVDLMPFIPHPSTYFSCSGLAWDVRDSGSKTLAIFLGKSSNGPGDSRHDFMKYAASLDEFTRNTIMDTWGLKSRLNRKRSATVANNPLLVLWQSRFLETVRHVWATGYTSAVSAGLLETRLSQPNNKSGKASCKSGSIDILRNEAFASFDIDVTDIPRNETLSISEAVSFWKDANRDYPANFYAYACPTKSSIKIISNLLKHQPDNKHAVEAGAGTGYWSALINSTGNTMLPYDISPPSQSTPNSYHGSTPTFLHVKSASIFKDSSVTTLHESAATLMLCYPPPRAKMAFTTLSTHIQYGGQTVILIGEWQGLTANAEFEELLTLHFYCSTNEQLPTWGTDATYLTIWERNDEKKTMCPDRDYFSPSFGYCSSQPCSNTAKRRCRFARCLQYCSDLCFQKHGSPRRACLALHMVQLPLEHDLSFDSDAHFVDLQDFDDVKQSAKKSR